MFRRLSQCVQFLTLSVCIAGAIHADEPISLRYTLAKGTSQINRVKTETKTSQTLMGNTVESTIAQTGIEVRVIDDVDAEGTAKIKTKTERLRVDLKLGPAGNYEFDSQKVDRDKSSTIGAAVTPLYERLVGSELQSEVTSRGVVKSVTGYAQLVGDLIQANPVAAQFAGGGSDEIAKLGAQGQWLVLSDKPVKAGDKWDNPIEMEVPKLGTFKGQQTVTLLSMENRDGHSIAKLSASTDISLDVNVKMDAAKVTGKITTANSSGSAEFDITAGKLLKQTSEVTLSGQLSVEVNNMVIPVQMSQTVSSEQAGLDKLPE